MSVMLFERQEPARSADEQLAKLLGEQPVKVSVLDVKPRRSYDLCRAVVVALLLSSVAGTWSMAIFLAHP